MWLCDMSWAVAFTKDANIATASTGNIVRVFRNVKLVRRNSAFIVWAPLFDLISGGRLLISQPRTILRARESGASVVSEPRAVATGSGGTLESHRNFLIR